MTKRVHLSLPVSELEKSIDFYEKLFATSATKREVDYANFRLSEPAIHLSLTVDPSEAGVGAGRSHFGIELETGDALASWTERLLAAGTPVRREQGVGCCYAKGDKTWVSDPDGHAWELWVRTSEDYDALEPDAACCGPAGESAAKVATDSPCC